MSNTKNVTFEEQILEIDSNTGEIMHHYKQKNIRVEREPDYIKLYLKDLLYLQDLPKKNNALLLALLTRGQYNSKSKCMQVYLNSQMKQEICEEVNMALDSIQNTLGMLVKGQILIRIGRGTYGFNPYFFGRGKWADISKARIEIDYSAITGRTYKVNLSSRGVDGEPGTE